MKPQEPISLSERIAWEKLVFFVIVPAFLLLGLAECAGKKQTPSPALSAVTTDSLPDNCHQEIFPRFGRLHPIIVCVEDGMEYSVAPVRPGSHWMENRYPAIIDSLHKREDWRRL